MFLLLLMLREHQRIPNQQFQSNQNCKFSQSPETWQGTDQEIFFSKIFRYLRSKMPSLVYYTDTIFLDSGRSIGKIFLPHALFLKGHNMSILGTLGQFLVLYPLFDCFTVNFGPLLRGKSYLCLTRGSPSTEVRMWELVELCKGNIYSCGQNIWEKLQSPCEIALYGINSVSKFKESIARVVRIVFLGGRLDTGL